MSGLLPKIYRYMELNQLGKLDPEVHNQFTILNKQVLVNEH